MKNWYLYVTYFVPISYTSYRLNIRTKYNFIKHTCVCLTLVKYPQICCILHSTPFLHSVVTDICDNLVPVLHLCDNLAPIFHKCEDLVPVLHTCEFRHQFFKGDNLVPIFTDVRIWYLNIWENLEPILHIRLVFHRLKTIKLYKFEHKFYTPKLIEIDHKFCQKCRIGTNSSQGVKLTMCGMKLTMCEICGSKSKRV